MALGFRGLGFRVDGGPLQGFGFRLRPQGFLGLPRHLRHSGDG